MRKISYLFGSCYQHYYQAATVVSFCPASVSLFLSLFLWCVCWPFCNMIFIVIFYLYYIQSAHCLLCALLWLHCWPRFAGHRIWLASAHNFNKQRLAVSLSVLLSHVLLSYCCTFNLESLQFIRRQDHCHFIWKTCSCRNEQIFNLSLDFSLHLMACWKKLTTSS